MCAGKKTLVIVLLFREYGISHKPVPVLSPGNMVSLYRSQRWCHWLCFHRWAGARGWALWEFGTKAVALRKLPKAAHGFISESGPRPCSIWRVTAGTAAAKHNRLGQSRHGGGKNHGADDDQRGCLHEGQQGHSPHPTPGSRSSSGYYRVDGRRESPGVGGRLPGTQ